MDLFQHRYYRLSRILMMVIGQWPYQSTRTKRALSLFMILPSGAIVPGILAIMKYRDNETMLLECFILYVGGAISFMKLFGFIVHSQKRMTLTNLIRTDWQLWSRHREVNILHGYAEQGQKIATVYTAMMYLAFLVVMIQPLLPIFIDILLKNGTTVKEFPYPVVYYNIDEQKYYFYLVMYSNVCIYFILTVVISNDVILVIYVQHVCGIFAALGHKLQRMGNNYDIPLQRVESPHKLDKKHIAHLAWCIARHNDAIEYATLIEATYTRTFFITCGLGMVLLNVVGLEVVMRSTDPTTAARYIFFILAILLYFYIECYVSQKLLDHSIDIRYYIYNSQWYKLPPKAQKMLQLMTMRSTLPCYLTAGKMLVLSVRSFWLAFKTAISYFGFLRSTQGL